MSQRSDLKRLRADVDSARDVEETACIDAAKADAAWRRAVQLRQAAESRYIGALEKALAHPGPDCCCGECAG